MSPERRREIAIQGGRSVDPANRSFSRNPELAAAAGAKGGLARGSSKARPSEKMAAAARAVIRRRENEPTRPLAEVVADRVAEILGNPKVKRVVVYRTSTGVLRASIFREQLVGPEMVGVYGRESTREEILEDIRA